MGPGVGAGFAFYIGGWISPPFVVGYASPAVLSLVPSRLPVSGGIVTLRGTGFGMSPCTSPLLRSAVIMKITAPPSASQLPNTTAAMLAYGSGGDAVATQTVLESPCSVINWSNTTIECVVQQGLDASVPVTVMIGGQNVTLHWIG